MIFLVVDDSPTQRRIILQTLKTIGFNAFIEAEDGLDAYNKMKAHKVDLVLSDWNMPILNGLELIALIRAHDEFKDIPVILITTKSSTEDVLTALKFKNIKYIIKPFSPTILEQKIKEVLNITLI